MSHLKIKSIQIELTTDQNEAPTICLATVIGAMSFNYELGEQAAALLNLETLRSLRDILYKIVNPEVDRFTALLDGLENT